MIHTAKLDTEHIVESEVITESETYLNEHGYQTDGKAYYSVVNKKQDGEDSGYIIKAVETTAVPFDQADVVSDTITVWICSCAGYRYHNGIADLEDRNTLEWEACKHVKQLGEYKHKRAANDDSQTGLDEI